MANNNLQATLGLNTDDYKKALDDAKRATKEFENETKKASDEVKKHSEEQAKTSKTIMDGRKSLRDFNASIKELKGQLLSLDEGSKEYQTTMQKLADETKRFKDINEIAALSANDLGERLNVMTQFGSQLASGFAVAQGGMALFGAESENLQKTFVKLQAAMAIVQGLQGLEGMTKTLPVIKSMVVNLTSAIKTQFKALLTNPWVALATAIAGVVVYLMSGTEWFKKLTGQIDDATTSSDKFGLSQKQLEEFQQNTIEKAGTLIGKYLQLRNEWQNLSSEQAKNKWLQENKQGFKDLGVAIESVNDAENLLIKNTSKFITSLINRSMVDSLKEQFNTISKDYIKAINEIGIQGGKTSVADLNSIDTRIWSEMKNRTVSTNGWKGYLQNGVLNENAAKLATDIYKEILKQDALKSAEKLGSSISEFTDEYVRSLQSLGLSQSTTSTSDVISTVKNTPLSIIANPTTEGQIDNNIKYYENLVSDATLAERKVINQKIAYWRELKKQFQNAGLETSKVQAKPIEIPSAESLYYSAASMKNAGLNTILNGMADAQLKANKGSENYFNEKISVLQGLMSSTSDLELYSKFDKELKATQAALQDLQNQQLQITNPIEFDKQQTEKSIELQNKKLNEQAEIYSGLANLAGNLGGVFDENTNKWLNFTANFLGQIPTLISAYQAITAAAAMKSAAETPIVGWLNMAAAFASTLALFASIPSFSTGGIVPGNSYSSDRVLCRLNSGEMVLNTQSQRNLFNLINNGGINTTSPQNEIKFKIQGSDLYGVLKNFNYKKSKVF